MDVPAEIECMILQYLNYEYRLVCRTWNRVISRKYKLLEILQDIDSFTRMDSAIRKYTMRYYNIWYYKYVGCNIILFDRPCGCRISSSMYQILRCEKECDLKKYENEIKEIESIFRKIKNIRKSMDCMREICVGYNNDQNLKSVFAYLVDTFRFVGINTYSSYMIIKFHDTMTEDMAKYHKKKIKELC
jgi:hypothetical protein